MQTRFRLDPHLTVANFRIIQRLGGRAIYGRKHTILIFVIIVLYFGIGSQFVSDPLRVLIMFYGLIVIWLLYARFVVPRLAASAFAKYDEKHAGTVLEIDEAGLRYTHPNWSAFYGWRFIDGLQIMGGNIILILDFRGVLIPNESFRDESERLDCIAFMMANLSPAARKSVKLDKETASKIDALGYELDFL